MVHCMQRQMCQQRSILHKASIESRDHRSWAVLIGAQVALYTYKFQLHHLRRREGGGVFGGGGDLLLLIMSLTVAINLQGRGKK